MKKILVGFLILSLALNVFLWSRLSKPAIQQKSAQANASEIEELQRQNKELQLHQASDSADADKRELIRLRNQVGQLRKQAGDAEMLRAQAAEAAQLRVQLATATQNLARTETAVSDAAKARADEAASLTCVNNLKQIGLSARIWASDNEDIFPRDLISMTNELGSPNVLLCPSDSTANRVNDWTQFNPSSISYRFLNPGGNDGTPEIVLATCPIHGHVCMSDGSVHRKKLTP